MAPSAHVKFLSKALFSLLLVAFFLASCVAFNPEDITNVDDGTVDPTITCPDGIVVLNLNGAENITLTDALSGVSSTGGTGDVTFSYDTNTFTLAHVGMTITITATATDSASPAATATCTFMVVITQVSTPTLTGCPDTALTGTENTLVEWTAPTATSLPDGATLVVTTTAADTVTATGGIFTVAGNYIVTFQVEDSNGNVISVGGSNLACPPFQVTITDPSIIPAPMGSSFALLMNTQAPSATNPFLIQNIADLVDLARVVNSSQMYSNINNSGPTQSNYRSANYLLANNITLSGTQNNFIPIGTNETTPFQGTFDGNSNTISGLRFNNIDNTTNIGFFGVISGSGTSISNLILTSININGGISVGALVGIMINNSSISNVSATGAVSGISNIGGLVGQMTNSSITNAYASVTVSSTTSSSGGLVGAMSASSMTNTFSLGTVTGSSSIGGLVGQMRDASSITNAYASGTVSSTGALIGGLVGVIENTATLRNTLAWGPTLGNSLVGGLVGSALLATSTITNSYWDNTPAGTGQDASSGTGATAQTTTALQMPQSATGIYANWNNLVSATPPGAGVVWNFGTTTDYPALEIPGSLFPSVACQHDSSGSGCPNPRQ